MRRQLKSIKRAIESFPENYLLHYNLGLTAYNLENNDLAEDAIITALKLRPDHTTSNLILAYINRDQGQRVYSLLALYHFLLLEPESARASSAYKLLQDQLTKGVSKKGDDVEISIENPEDPDKSGASELMLSLLEASKYLEKNKDKTDEVLFAENTESFFKMAGGLDKGDNQEFWQNLYISFFENLSIAGHAEAFCNYISLSKEDGKADEWLDNNQDQFNAFVEWYRNYWSAK